MSASTSSTASRTVVANISLSLDGRISGAGGEYDMGWIVPHALSDGARDHMIRVTSPATTVLLGRKNYEGFSQFWPAVADDPTADQRDRSFAQWLNAVEKVVFSTTLQEASWQNAKVSHQAPADVIGDLRRQGDGDIIVLASASVIRDLLNADAIDRLSITLCPEVVGGGARLFDDDVIASGSWALADKTLTDSGALCLLFDRVR